MYAYTGESNHNLDWRKTKLGRAELAFVVMDIAYVQNNILTDTAFYTLMVTAFFMNISVPLSIRLWKPYCVKSEI